MIISSITKADTLVEIEEFNHTKSLSNVFFSFSLSISKLQPHPMSFNLMMSPFTHTCEKK